MKHTTTSVALSNGIMLHSINTSDSHVVETRLYFNAGFEHFDKDTVHVPHLLEHLLLANGGTHESEEAMTRTLQKLGAYANASTDYETVTVYLSAPTANYQAALTILLGSVFCDKLTNAVFEKERSIVLRELYEQYDALDNQLTCSLLSEFFPKLSPENWQMHVESTEALELKTVQKAYDRYITTDNMQVIVAGKINASLARSIGRALQSLPRSTSTRPEVAVTVHNGKDVISALPFKTGGTALLLMVYVCPIDGQESHKQRVAYNLATQLLFDSPTAVLQRTLRDKGLAYSISFDAIMMSQWQVSIVTASVDSSKSHIAAVEIFRHLQLYASGHITQQELDEACLFIKSNIHQGADTVGDLADWYSRDVIRRRPLTSAEQEIEQIENLTIQNIANATTAMFVDSRIQAVVVDPDAPFWVEDLGKLRSNAKKIADQDKINTHYDAGIDALATKRAEAPERYGYGWAAYYSLAFVVWMAGVFCPTVIPEPGQAVSLLLYTIDYNWQYGVALYVPYGIAAILAFVRGRYEKLAERYYIALNFAVAMVFAYGYFAIFGPTQLSELPWYGTVLAVLQIVFFLVATPVAFIALLWYLWLRRPARRV